MSNGSYPMPGAVHVYHEFAMLLGFRLYRCGWRSNCDLFNWLVYVLLTGGLRHGIRALRL